MSSILKKLSPAKINLFLEIKNKREDGYHNIESLMTLCNYGDFLKIKKSDKFCLKLNGPFGVDLEKKNNLIEKAKYKLEHLYKKKFDVEVILTKNLPIASGMAGGSSNAATFIKCIKEMFDLKDVLGFDDLLLSLGADVPFCYHGKTALVRGIGEILNFIDIKENYYLLLINPKIEISTQKIFNELKKLKKDCLDNLLINLKETVKFDFFSTRENHLQDYAISQSQEIKEILLSMDTFKGSLLSRMTGSGATCFALFDNLNDLKHAEISAKKKFKNYWIKSSKLVNSLKHI